MSAAAAEMAAEVETVEDQPTMPGDNVEESSMNPEEIFNPIEADPDFVKLVELTGELMQLCRATQGVYIHDSDDADLFQPDTAGAI